MQLAFTVRCIHCGQDLGDSASGQTVRCPECGRINQPARTSSRAVRPARAWARYILATAGPGLLLGSGASFGVSQFGTPTSTAGTLVVLLGAAAVLLGNVYVQAVVVERYLGPPLSASLWLRASWLYSLLTALTAWILLGLLDR